MDHSIAFSNGQFIPADQLVVQPQDAGFMLGVTVAEQLRTFGGELFEADRHLDRLQTSLDAIGLDGVRAADLYPATKKVVDHNHALLDPNDDLGVTLFVTPGLYPTYCPVGARQPTVGIHTYRLPFRLWADKYGSGQRCRFVSVPQVSAACWPRELKCRSRMHYFLADREARHAEPDSRAILLDEHGNVNEASTANVVAYFENEGLISPPAESILHGISLQVVADLASQLNCKFTSRTLRPEVLAAADEILLTSTPFCVLPVSRLNERQLTQRGCFRWLLKAWSNRVGVDIEAQAKAFASADR